MEPYVSIIIITFNRGRTLKRILPHLKTSTRVRHEVIVVDDGSTDDTYGVLFPAIESGEISYYRIEHSGVALARNFGVSKAMGNLISFIDSDIICLENWLERLLQAARERPDAAILGAARYNRDDTGYGEFFEKYPHPVREFAPVAKIGIGASLVRKELFDEIGGFDANFVFGWEDTEFCWRANLLGYQVGYVYDAIVLHLQERTTESRVSPDQFVYESMKNRLFTHLKLMDLPSVFSRVLKDLALMVWTFPFHPARSLLILRALGWNLAQYAAISKERSAFNQRRKLPRALIRELEKGEIKLGQINEAYLQRITELRSQEAGEEATSCPAT
jgi:GT2 family glycosyltransferase